MAGNLSTAYQWLINACKSPSIGYSQAYRRGQTVYGITYYDCSSIISEACYQAKFTDKNPWFTTYTMGAYLEQWGFEHYDSNIPWLPGDILVINSTRQHTEMVYKAESSGGVTMGAHSSQVPLADQVSINDYVTSPDYYTDLYRFPGGAAGYQWIAKNAYLSETEMQNNAYCFYCYMWAAGWSLNAICGALGCIEHESTINPGIWESLIVNPSRGFGLVQWTPSTNFTDWADQKGYDHDSGDAQCEWIDTQTGVKGQWIPSSNYPETWEEFKGSNKDIGYLSLAWEYNFERPGVTYDPTADAQKWYDYLKDMTPYPPQPNKPIPSWGAWYLTQYGAISETIRKRRIIRNDSRTGYRIS